jgi:hypothetical protein
VAVIIKVYFKHKAEVERGTKRLKKPMEKSRKQTLLDDAEAAYSISIRQTEFSKALLEPVLTKGCNPCPTLSCLDFA